MNFSSENVTAELLQEVFDIVEKSEIDLRAQRVFSLEETHKAHRYLEEAKYYGKVVLVL